MNNLSAQILRHNKDYRWFVFYHQMVGLLSHENWLSNMQQKNVLPSISSSFEHDFPSSSIILPKMAWSSFLCRTGNVLNTVKSPMIVSSESKFRAASARALLSSTATGMVVGDEEALIMRIVIPNPRNPRKQGHYPAAPFFYLYFCKRMKTKEPVNIQEKWLVWLVFSMKSEFSSTKYWKPYSILTTP